MSENYGDRIVIKNPKSAKQRREAAIENIEEAQECALELAKSIDARVVDILLFAEQGEHRPRIYRKIDALHLVRKSLGEYVPRPDQKDRTIQDLVDSFEHESDAHSLMVRFEAFA